MLWHLNGFLHQFTAKVLIQAKELLHTFAEGDPGRFPGQDLFRCLGFQ
jgi:hypothetical protein